MAETTAPTGKLIRDRIPEIMAADGAPLATIELVEDRLFRCALLDKLVDEAIEAREAGDSGLVEELADVLEVLDSLLPLAANSVTTILSLKSGKRSTHGGFDKRLLGLGLVREQAAAPPLAAAGAPITVSRGIYLDERHYAYEGVVYDRNSFDDPSGYDAPRRLTQSERLLVDRIVALQDSLATYSDPDDWYQDEMDGHWRFFGHDQGPYLARRVLGIQG